MHKKFVKSFEKYNNLEKEILELIYDKSRSLKSKYYFYNFCKDYLDHRYNDRFDIIKNYELYNCTKRSKTLDNYVLRFGNILGHIKWNNYCKKQAYSNSFEYKQNKFGWTYDQFVEYNNMNSQTLNNMISRHGDNTGVIKWNEFKHKQKDAGCSLKYFQTLYGLDDGLIKYKEVNAKKKLNRECFIRKYGEEIGCLKWEEFCIKRSINNKNYYSKISQKLFNVLMNYISDDYANNIFYAQKNYEYIFNHKSFDQCYYVDFYDKEKNKIIEFYGNYYHCNPLMFNSDYTNTRINLTAQQIWDRDTSKNYNIKRCFHSDILIIWEKDYINNLDETIEICRNFLNI